MISHDRPPRHSISWPGQQRRGQEALCSILALQKGWILHDLSNGRRRHYHITPFLCATTPNGATVSGKRRQNQSSRSRTRGSVLKIEAVLVQVIWDIRYQWNLTDVRRYWHVMTSCIHDIPIQLARRSSKIWRNSARGCSSIAGELWLALVSVVVPGAVPIHPIQKTVIAWFVYTFL